MKALSSLKKIVFSVGFLLVSSSAFANFFSHRFVELKANVPVNVSNNVFALNDFLQKEIILDLPEITGAMPKKGFDVSIQALPEISLTVDIPRGLIVGVDVGVQVFSNLDISKDLFEFLSTGHDFTKEEEFRTSINGYADVFAFARVDLGWNLGKKISFVFQPTLFSSLLHASANKAYVSFKNTNTGTFAYDIDASFNLYSPFELKSDVFSDPNYLISQAMDGAGFDIGGTVNIDLFKYLSLNGSIRFPLVASHLDVYTPYSIKSQLSVDLDTILEDSMESPNMEPVMGDAVVADYKINRPMKFFVGGNFHPWGNFMSFYGGFGVGYKHPGAELKEERGAYTDYLAGVKISLFNMISLYGSTERTDEIFIHKASLALNLRLIEVDAGVAYESASLQKSFSGSGLGAFATVCIGF
ncbi:MAG: hypothetical protein MJ188_02680 [Treponema sp.]|nr:hypothetical protein [Treponema sp.]